MSPTPVNPAVSDKIQQNASWLEMYVPANKNSVPSLAEGHSNLNPVCYLQAKGSQLVQSGHAPSRATFLPWLSLPACSMTSAYKYKVVIIT